MPGLQRRVESVLEARAVRQPGQEIGPGELLDLLLRFIAVGDVGMSANRATIRQRDALDLDSTSVRSLTPVAFRLVRHPQTAEPGLQLFACILEFVALPLHRSHVREQWLGGEELRRHAKHVHRLLVHQDDTAGSVDHADAAPDMVERVCQ